MVPELGFDRGSAVPFHRQIYDGYRSAILGGMLRSGDRMPSSRGLAQRLGISRLPVLAAYDQLRHEGYLDGRAGSGTFVAGIPDQLVPPRTDRARPGPVDDWPEHRMAARPFQSGLPALDRFPSSVWAKLVRRHVRPECTDALAYGDARGFGPLREAIADHVRSTRAVRCEAAQVLIVSGSQMAIQIAAMAFHEPGDVAAVEEPGYASARFALRMAGYDIEPIPVDRAGIDVARLALPRGRVRLVFVTPSHQYPLGVAMPAGRRLELLRWAERNDAWILEDDYDREFRYVGRPLPALQGMDGADRVVYIGTFSKVMFPDLRIGYLVVPPPLVRSFVRVRTNLDLAPSTLLQAALADFVTEGHHARHVRRMQVLYRARRDALVESLDRHAGDLLSVDNSEAGMHLTAFLPADTDDHEVVRRAAARGVSTLPLSPCYAGPAPRPGLILGFAAAPEDQADQAVRTLLSAIREVRPA